MRSKQSAENRKANEKPDFKIAAESKRGAGRMKPGEKMLMRFMGKLVPVRIIAILDFGIECEFLADLPPVRKGDTTIAGTANLFPIVKNRKKDAK